jgi:hypothetical protein
MPRGQFRFNILGSERVQCTPSTLWHILRNASDRNAREKVWMALNDHHEQSGKSFVEQGEIMSVHDTIAIRFKTRLLQFPRWMNLLPQGHGLHTRQGMKP